MILAKLNLNEEALLEFEMSIFGTAEQASQTRFVLEGKDFDIICKCSVTADSVEVKIPKLKGLLESGTYNSKLEVILGDKIFTPLSESVEFLPLVEFDVKAKGVEAIKEGVTVKVKNATSEDSKPRNVGLQALLDEGYQVVKYNEFDILKKGDKYVGIVTESKVIRSKAPHAMLSNLIDELTAGG